VDDWDIERSARDGAQHGVGVTQETTCDRPNLLKKVSKLRGEVSNETLFRRGVTLKFNIWGSNPELAKEDIFQIV